MKKGDPLFTNRLEVLSSPFPRIGTMSTSTSTSSAQYTLEARSLARGLSRAYIYERTS